MIKLNDLKFIDGSMKKKKRVARGNSGKMAGRGLKGQKARSGVALKNFQGGQTPLERRFPKHNAFYVKEKAIETLPLKYLDALIDELCENQILNKTENGSFLIDKILLENLGLISGKKKVKLIGNTNFPLEIEVNASSKGAADSILKNNGKLIILGE